MADRVRVKVPASTANLGPGFDSIGMALDMYLWIEMAIAQETTVQLIGERVQGLPKDKSNLIYQVAKQVFQEAGVAVPELAIAMCSDIPLTRGLGSSASAIVGGMVAANALLGEKALTREKLFQMATAIEGHPDNVGPALYGGIVIATWDGENVKHIVIQPPKNLLTLVVIPQFQLATEMARNVLPIQYSRTDAIFNISHGSLLTAALCTGNLSLLRDAMRDRLHEPYRSSLIPGLEQILAEACDHGALGVSLSGAGPTVLALVDQDSDCKEELEEFMVTTFRNHRIGVRAVWLKPNINGTQFILDMSEDLAQFPSELDY